MGEEDLSRLLERVGAHLDLGAYEIEAYLKVLERGRITASELADRTDVPQPRVYDTVRSLSDRGLVELHESRPMSVVAIDPGEAFEDLESSFDLMLNGLVNRYNEPEPEGQAVTLVKSRSTILRHLGGIIDGAEYELTLSLTPRLLSRYESELRSARERGVITELLVTPASQAPDPERFPYTEVATSVRARRGITTPIIGVGDGSHSLYATQNAVRSDRERYGVIFNQSELGFLVAGFFGTVLWPTAEVLTTDGKNLEFPRRYASIRRCIKDIKTREDSFHARVSGRWVESGKSCHVEGVVTAVRIEDSQEVASLTISTDRGEVTVGGRVAAFEDIEAHEIYLDRTESDR